MRCRHLVLVALLPLAVHASSASATTWEFEYVGFFDTGTGLFDPSKKVDGKFTAQDLDGDAIIELSELQSFEFAGREYILPAGRCNLDRYLTCAFDSFSYVNGALNFGLRWWGNDEAISGWGGGVQTGVSYHGYSYRGSESWTSEYLWTPQTTFTIDPPASPVPEPTTAAMLAIGMTGLALWGRRRRS